MTILRQPHSVSDLIDQASFSLWTGPIYQLIKGLTGARQETITEWYIETWAQINVEPLPLGPAPPSPAAITTHYKLTNDTILLMVSVSTSRLNLHFYINPTLHSSSEHSQDKLLLLSQLPMKLTPRCWHTQRYGASSGWRMFIMYSPLLKDADWMPA